MGMQIDPKNVVGRDELIRRIWSRLRMPAEQGSLRFTAERRVGKTTVMTKMAVEPADGFDVLFLEVEGIDSCDALTELLLNRIRPHLTKTESAKGWFSSFWEGVGGVEIGGVIKLPEKNKLGWQATLEKAIEGFCQNRSDRLILLMFDELPYMLQKIEEVSSKAVKPHEALTLLDTLRALRQRCPNLRMIFAGSVGLHHVLRDLRQAKLAAEPVNNMLSIEIHPLEDRDALQLASQLLKAEQVKFANTDQDIAKRLIAQTSNVPFYMERIIGQLGLLGRPITLHDVDSTVLEQLTSDRDPWEMEHFRSRLEIYYRRSVDDTNGRSIPEAAIARCILDHFAVNDEPQSIDDVWSMIRSQLALTDRQVVVQMLRSLGQDHYLMSDTQKRYTFRFPLIKRWWKMAQGLES
ncbi:MAG: hypothetical protein JWM11_3366 [Planctomycetaceae bacterium]|nr:hypothetical protein [Planctomycetaceae bacterium]